MNHSKLTATLASVSLFAALALVGCTGSPEDTAPETSAASIPASPPESQAPVESLAPAEPPTDIEASVQAFIATLDELGIAHSEPVRAEVGMSGAKARFGITVNGFDAGINVFPDADTLATWGEASDSFGGIYIAYGNAVLTLNSSEGIANSAEVAPRIAEAIGGQAHGI
ncbi:hypothetical protein [Microbacterium sp. P03]|uniref:hypothetical protein n=1 Tax=Microbacterium sp. P03 TaxID=3366946 RepID=UPI003746813D